VSNNNIDNELEDKLNSGLIDERLSAAIFAGEQIENR
jgi:hypothetical protein